MPKAKDDNEDLTWLEKDANDLYESTGEIPDLWTLMALREARESLPLAGYQLGLKGSQISAQGSERGDSR